jgi:hypothetical protein
MNELEDLDLAEQKVKIDDLGTQKKIQKVNKKTKKSTKELAPLSTLSGQVAINNKSNKQKSAFQDDDEGDWENATKAAKLELLEI